MKNTPARMGLESTTVVALHIAHRATYLLHGVLQCWQKLAGFYCTATELLALCYRLCWFNQIHAACLKVVGSSPGAANFFLI